MRVDGLNVPQPKLSLSMPMSSAANWETVSSTGLLTTSRGRQQLWAIKMGVHAPGLNDYPTALKVSHHLLLSHGWAVPVLRRNSPGAEVGITLILFPLVPGPSNTAVLPVFRKFDGYFNRWFLDPLYGRHYPADIVAEYIDAGHLPADGLTFVKPGDLEAIAARTDFLGVNYYSPVILRSEVTPENENEPMTLLYHGPEYEYTDIGMMVYPDGLRHLLSRLYFEYQPGKMYITENGASYSDGPDRKGTCAGSKAAELST